MRPAFWEEEEEMSDSESSSPVGRCCVCGSECNWMSQACGTCARKMSMGFSMGFRPEHRRAFRDDDGRALVETDEHGWWWFDGRCVFRVRLNGLPEGDRVWFVGGTLHVNGDRCYYSSGGKVSVLKEASTDDVVLDVLDRVRSIYGHKHGLKRRRGD
jgi:hypothetical protein